jgi:hypothetical protein
MAGRAPVKLPNLNLQRWFTSASPQLATSAGGDDRFGTTLFSSRSGGSGGGGDDFGFDDDETQVSDAPAESPRSTRGGGSGGNRGNGSGGRQRTIQFQPEDRYWTEYLRIALPIIGLILMLGLFWFWATRIIGDDPDTTDPTPTEEIGAVSTIGANPTATVEATTETTVAVTPEPTNEPAAEPTATTDGGDNEAEETPEDTEEEPTTEPDDSGSGEFAADDSVVINDEGEGGVNMRSDPTTQEENIVVQLQPGDELTIVSGPEEGDDLIWYEVVDGDGNNGYVAADYLEAAP